MPTTHKPAEAEIARTAYFIWEQEGRPHGRDRAHWLQAEKLLKRPGRYAAKGDGAAAAGSSSKTLSKPAAGRHRRG